MAEAVIARQKGDGYQASFFWLKACKLYQKHTGAHKIEWEADSSFGFDDVVLHYDPPKLNKNDEITVEKYQVKFHVDHKRAFTTDSLIDPSFIGTTQATILSRLYEIYKADSKSSTYARYYIVNTWGLDSTDELRNILANDGSIRLEKLFDGTTDMSKTGKIRNSWKNHLGITSDDVLKEVIKPLRIEHSFSNEQVIKERLNENLISAGFKPIREDQRTGGYFELIQKLHEDGIKAFTKEELLELCKREGLYVGREEAYEDLYTIGIRSFARGAETLEAEVDDLLCLLPYFSGRYIIEESSWPTIYSLVSAFSEKAVKVKKTLVIHLDTHLSIAFIVGRCLDFKYGVDVSLIQKTAAGRLVWKPELGKMQSQPEGLWSFETEMIDEGGKDLVISISVTHNIGKDVTDYAKSEIKNVSKILRSAIKPLPSNTSIKDANQIISAVQELVRYIRTIRSNSEKQGNIHLLMAAPNAFAFFLGQQSIPLGKLVLYEYDFENLKTGTYNPAITLPL